MMFHEPIIKRDGQNKWIEGPLTLVITSHIRWVYSRHCDVVIVIHSNTPDTHGGFHWQYNSVCPLFPLSNCHTLYQSHRTSLSRFRKRTSSPLRLAFVAVRCCVSCGCSPRLFLHKPQIVWNNTPSIIPLKPMLNDSQAMPPGTKHFESVFIIKKLYILIVVLSVVVQTKRILSFYTGDPSVTRDPSITETSICCQPATGHSINAVIL